MSEVVQFASRQEVRDGMNEVEPQMQLMSDMSHPDVAMTVTRQFSAHGGRVD